MISEPAKEGFNYLLQEAVKKSLAESSEDICEIEPIADGDEIKEKEMVMLTISSYLFRMIACFYFTLNNITKDHFAKIIKANPNDMDDKAFYDAIGEFGNMYCGSLNRDVGRYFPYVGLSTPNILEKKCADYLSSLDCGHLQHFKIAVNQSVTFHASLCVCDYADIDFTLETDVEEDVSGGELELF